MIILPCLPIMVTHNYLGAIFLLACAIGALVVLLKGRKQ